jgi:hypothetical protein
LRAGTPVALRHGQETTMNPIESIHLAPTSTVHSIPGRFERALRGAAAGLAEGVATGLDLAAPFVPAGNVLSAAVRTAGAAALGADTGGATAGAGTSGDGDVISATRALQQQSQSFNLEYLQLQEDMQRESRTFSALSNVMKVKHDSAQAAIQNIR